MLFEIYQHQEGLYYGQWRWRLRSLNYKTIANSGESYHNKADCLHAINLVINTNRSTLIM
jgi:uncharacterized protein